MKREELEARLRKWNKRVDRVRDIHPLKILYWEVTRKCNMRCIHCGSPSDASAEGAELTTKEAIDAFAQIAADFDLSHVKFVTLTGGEPLIRSDLLDILEELCKLGYPPVTIQTNGIILAKQPNLINQLISLNVRGVGTNLDGIGKTHDTFRALPGGYTVALDVIRQLVGHRDRITVTVSTCVSRININELEEIAEVVFQLSPHRWRLIFIDPIGRAALDKTMLLRPEDYRQVLSFAVKMRASDRECRTEIGCGHWLGIQWEGRVRPYLWNCVAGIYLLGILYDGSIASCSNIDRTYIEGNVRTDRIRDVWENRYQRFRTCEWRRIGDCIECDQWEFCRGGPMHARRPDGSLSHCIYKAVTEDKDYFK